MYCNIATSHSVGLKKTTIPVTAQPMAPKPNPKEPSGPAGFNPEDILKARLSSELLVDVHPPPPPPAPSEHDWFPRRFIKKG